MAMANEPSSAAGPRANTAYTRRIDRVIDHLRANLHRPVKLDELAEVACLSEFHFHRIFKAISGETVNNFTSRLRLEKATRLLRYSERSLTAIALDCGFSSPSTFSRAFQSGYGITPSGYRKGGELNNSKICKEAAPGLGYVLPMSEEERRAAFPVRVMDFPRRQAAYIRVTNTTRMETVQAAFKAMVGWAKSQPGYAQGVLFGMSADDPHVTPPHLYRYEVCFATSGPFACAEGMSALAMPAMRYAVVKVSGDLYRIATAWDYLYRSWLIRSEYEPQHAPALEIFTNKEQATDWSHLDLELCVPVRKMSAY
ncbi:MAG TPA: AraC family transcriptional regulator [Burkholderiaceae bacterium]